MYTGKKRKVGGMRATGVADIKIALRGMESMRQGAKERSRHINGHKRYAETPLQQPSDTVNCRKGGPAEEQAWK